MIISQTPLRISFAGGGTDLKEFWAAEPGKVLSTSIDKYVFVVIKKRFDDLIVLNYTACEIVDSVAEIKHELIREAMLKTGISKGVEITTLADIPSKGSGLGSSSSVTVGLLNALYAYAGKQVTAEQMAQEACDIEIDILDKPIGKQDQYIAAYGGLNEITFHPDYTVSVEPINNNSRDKRVFVSNILLFYTNITRKSSEILTEQKAETRNKFEILKQMRNQVHEVRKVLENGAPFDRVGHILNDAWILKRQLASKITNPIIDEMYERARKAGALGGKISGAGGGGFLMLYVPRENQNYVREELNEFKELPFMLEPDGSKIIFNMRKTYWR